ncbi:MAG: hypothetical protein K0R00_210 [Herbinix sp.]|jgi:hypothetical protein|nr:hypothetical protein [Herbinix sp.]
MGIVNISKEALILGGAATVGIFGGLLVINRKKLAEEKKDHAHCECDDTDEICFDDLNENIIDSSFVDDDDINIG